jgi:hypothetical protein
MSAFPALGSFRVPFWVGFLTIPRGLTDSEGLERFPSALARVRSGSSQVRFCELLLILNNFSGSFLILGLYGGEGILLPRGPSLPIPYRSQIPQIPFFSSRLGRAFAASLLYQTKMRNWVPAGNPGLNIFESLFLVDNLWITGGSAGRLRRVSKAFTHAPAP